ncbi:2OG-Fe(II) oxygenase [Robertkochia sediminum]|uniref:2OG-Fe(II) oxygenase n=1 Tax=Robertkochia sediminum TaxID=2785326 RepID=UPI001934995D|nr:2OG-Fe(II) oxygenase [Robertkochia sediminum]MBL7471317.1 2OG-Fe(II) oxygenase [Robertkochia sediminum]
MLSGKVLEQSGFREEPLFERIIEDLSVQRYSISDHFFNDQAVTLLRDSLLEKYEDDKFRKSAIGDHFNEQVIKSVRGDFIHWIPEGQAGPAEQIFFDRIGELITYLNRTCFMGILEREFHYAVYPKGTFYLRHLDTFRNDDRRKLSIVCYLNDDSWDPANGGELTLYLPGEDGEVAMDIYPLPGRVVIFESQVLEHEVKPVKAGERYSITGWLKTR